MKNQNKRDLEKHWAKEAAKNAKKAAKKINPPRQAVNQAAAKVIPEARES